MFLPQIRSLTERCRQCLQDPAAAQIPDLPDLTGGSLDRLSDIGRFTVDAAVHRIAQVLEDAGIFRRHQRDICSHQLQKRYDVLRILQIDDKVPLAEREACMDPLFSEYPAELAGLGSTEAPELEMISLLRVTHKPGTQKHLPQIVPRLRAAQHGRGQCPVQVPDPSLPVQDLQSRQIVQDIGRKSLRDVFFQQQIPTNSNGFLY